MYKIKNKHKTYGIFFLVATKMQLENSMCFVL
jgi:hypothetical protein